MSYHGAVTFRNALALLCLAALFLTALSQVAPILLWAILIPFLISITLTVVFVQRADGRQNPPQLYLSALLPSRAPPAAS
jgi:hypothetical protein